MDGIKYKYFSIIIPVFNNSLGLEKVLQSLSRLDYPKEFYEIIVIDNNSTDGIGEVINKFPKVVWQEENKQSSYSARNKGISIAKGEVLAFVDSDCVVSEDWLREAAILFFKQKNLSLLAGKVEMVYRHKRPNIFEYVDSVRFLNQEIYVQQGYAATANLFIRNDIFKDNEKFLDILKSGGDYELTSRLVKKGYRIDYSEKVKVYHESRDTFEKIKSKTKRTSRGQKILIKLGLLKNDTKLLRFILPKKTIPHNINYKNFNGLERMQIYILFNIFHYLNIYYRYL